MGPGAGGPSPRAAIGVALITIALTAVRLLSQSPPPVPSPVPPDEMLSELTGRVIAALAPAGQVSLDAPDAVLKAAVTARLSARGVQVVEPADGVPLVRVTCLESLRDLVCAGAIEGPAPETVLVARARGALQPPPAVRVALELRPILTLDRRILDLVRSGDEMFALAADAVLRYENERDRWRLAGSHALSPMRPWPRDLRGRLRVSPRRLEAFLPGVTCAGGSAPPVLTCVEGSHAWPVEIEDASLEPLRNYFTTREGLAFYGIARLQGDPGARWIAATIDHRLSFVDENRQAAATAVRGDDVVALSVPCFPAGLVVAATRDVNGRALTAFEVIGRALVAAASPLAVTGEVTALWPIGSAALVVTHLPGVDRYVASELSVSCSR